MMEFVGFPKIARLNREMVVTEKIDGTNASIEIVVSPEIKSTDDLPMLCVAVRGEYQIYAGSRTRYITPQNDNHGFAKWVEAHADELVGLGPGKHFGEWWGRGIQRGYGLSEKQFSLFNVSRWVPFRSPVAQISNPEGDPNPRVVKMPEVIPACCGVVPVLYTGLFNTFVIEQRLAELQHNGSFAAPGFMNPEGVVIYHTHANQMFKVTLEKDEAP